MFCQLCERDVENTTRHHLIPRTRHKNKKTKKTFSREQMNETIDICRPCHSNVHAVFTEKELEGNYRTLESLASHPDIVKFTQWIATKPDGTHVPNRDSRIKHQR